MKFGDHVMINLDIAQEIVSSMACPCCGCDLTQAKRQILRAYAEAQWKYGGSISGYEGTCPVCDHTVSNLKEDVWIYCDPVKIDGLPFNGACIPMALIQKLEVEKDKLE